MTSVLSLTFLDGDSNCPLSVESNNAVVHRILSSTSLLYRSIAVSYRPLPLMVIE